MSLWNDIAAAAAADVVIKHFGMMLIHLAEMLLFIRNFFSALSPGGAVK